MASCLPPLQSKKVSQRLEAIASLRSCGLSEQLDLPQLVVFGDQSSGKSSVLEGITGLPFPRQDDVCTKFPTEVICIHTDGPFAIHAEVIPCRSRWEESRASLSEYSRQLDDFGELPSVISEVSDLMGLRGPQHPDGPGFCEDVLRLSVKGPTNLHLTIVDLPGLIVSPEDDQRDEDQQTVHRLADSYMKNPRTIILAIVQAPNDMATQAVIRRAKVFDPLGERTVGVMTKPDMINAGVESKIALFSNNQGKTKLKLGFFIVRNPAPEEIAMNWTLNQREKQEMAFFNRSPWKEQSLNLDRIGISKLRSYLQQLLDTHIERELPSVKAEALALSKKASIQLSELGEERSTTEQARAFLVGLAMRFHILTRAALGGEYGTSESAFFSNGAQIVRLRACIQEFNTDFAKDMHDHGAKFKISEASLGIGDHVVEGSHDTPPRLIFDDAELHQTFVDDFGMAEIVLRTHRRTRGLELPGSYNHNLLAELFHLQSCRWEQIAKNHLAFIARNLIKFIDEVVKCVTPEENVRHKIYAKIETALEQNVMAAEAELKKLCDDNVGPPITYNHYYFDNVQKARNDKTTNLRTLVDQIDTYQKSNWTEPLVKKADIATLLESLEMSSLKDVEAKACSEVRADLDSYYEVTRKTFVDNVCIQVIERHLLRSLSNVFSPEMAAQLSDEELLAIGGEGENTKDERKRLRNLHENLQIGLGKLRAM